MATIKTEKAPGANPRGTATPAGETAGKSFWRRLQRQLGERIGTGLWAHAPFRRWFVAGLFYALILLTLLSGGTPEVLDLEEGQVAPIDIMAPRDVVDRFRTNQLREEAARQAIREAAQDPANFDINPAVALHQEEWVGSLFSALERARQRLLLNYLVARGSLPEEAATAPGEPAVPEQPGTAESHGELEPLEEGPSEVPAAEADSPVPREQGVLYTTIPIGDEDVEEAIRFVRRELGVEPAAALVAYALRASPEVFEEARAAAGRLTGEFLAQRRIGEGDVGAARGEVAAFLEEKGLDEGLRDLVREAVSAAVVPNLILSPEKVERARQDAMRNVQDIVVREGQVIVRRGDPVRAEHVQLLRDLGLLQSGTHYGEWLGAALLVLVLFAFVGAYAHQFYRALLTEVRLLALFGVVVLLVTGLLRVASLVPWDGALYLVPVALASMLVALLIDSRLGFVATVVLAVLTGYVARGELAPVVMACAGGFTGVFSVSKISQRGDLTRAGFIIGAVATFVLLALALTRFVPFAWEYGFLGIVNGLVAAVSTIGLLPYLEGLFGITSTIRLLELSNPNQPLLRKLLMEAPGSYHHSIIVGNLSEAAADAIGADSLLVRVGALYHDIGKTKRPYFFVENQFGAENPHDKISPSLSTLIIISHVKDGVEMAREHGLPEVLTAFIREHHGTALVKYFYQKACENARGEPVDEKDFRYPGPRPQSRETAIVMLADSVEAAVRSLSRPSPGRIEGLVRKIIKEKLAEGELDESDLTLRDLDTIADAFVRVLTGIFHKRVEYPELPAQEPEKKAEAAN